MKKASYIIAVVITLILINSGCSNEEASNENNSKANDDSVSTEEEGSQGDHSSTDKKDALNVQLSGTVTYKGHHLTVEGKTNLPEGASVFVNPTAFTSVILMGTSGPAKVKKNGAFVYDTPIPEDYDSGLNVKIRFRPEDSTSDSIKKKYGEFGEDLKGSLVHLYEVSDEKLGKQASTSVYLPLKKGDSLVKEITTPDLQKPDDYGNEKVRMQAEVTYDKNLIYIEGESNLIEGS